MTTRSTASPASRQDLCPPRRTFREARFPVLVHDDVYSRLEELGQPQLSRRASLILHHLVAMGRTSVVKGTRGVNAGWRRSPLGGHNGSHYYLWWSPASRLGSDHSRAVFVRAVRHHDETDEALPESGPNDAHLVDWRALGFGPEDGGKLIPPWSPEQLEFARSAAPVRVLRGEPGSGKTAALWHSVALREGERILYLTWSSELSVRTEEYLLEPSTGRGLLAPESRLLALDFASLVGRVLERDVPKVTVADLRSRFVADLQGRNIFEKELGPWKKRPESLYSELRAHLIGRDRSLDEFLEARGGAHSRAARDLAARLEVSSPDGMARWFPDLQAAREATDKLAGTGPLASDLVADRIVVDEAQDLTMVELQLITSLYRRTTSTRPGFLLISGDEGQTVVPTDFDFGELNDHLTRSFGAPKVVDLHSNLRSPKAICEVIDRSTTLYKQVAKPLRPKSSVRPASDFFASAKLLSVQVTLERAPELVRRLLEEPGVAVIRVGERIPSWARPFADRISTPEQAKGVEFQVVCLLGAGELLEEIFSAKDSPTDQLETRARADRLRVALSRSTETLALIELEHELAFVERANEFLQGERVTQEALLAFAAVSQTSPLEKIEACVAEARATFETLPVQAWHKLKTAFDLVRSLGNEDLGQEVVTRTIEDTARHACRILLAGSAGISPADCGEVGVHALRLLGSTQLEASLSALSVRPFFMWASEERLHWLERVAAESLASAREWIRLGLRPHRHLIRADLALCSADPRVARVFSGRVEDWLLLIEHEDPLDGASSLREQAARSLLDGKDPAAALAVITRLPSAHPLLLAEAFEQLERFDLAAMNYEEGERPAEALRCLRRAGHLQKSIALAERLDDPCLPVLRSLAATIESLEALAIDGTLTPLELAQVPTLAAARREETTLQRKSENAVIEWVESEKRKVLADRASLAAEQDRITRESNDLESERRQLLELRARVDAESSELAERGAREERQATETLETLGALAEDARQERARLELEAGQLREELATLQQRARSTHIVADEEERRLRELREASLQTTTELRATQEQLTQELQQLVRDRDAQLGSNERLAAQAVSMTSAIDEARETFHRLLEMQKGLTSRVKLMKEAAVKLESQLENQKKLLQYQDDLLVPERTRLGPAVFPTPPKLTLSAGTTRLKDRVGISDEMLRRVRGVAEKLGRAKGASREIRASKLARDLGMSWTELEALAARALERALDSNEVLSQRDVLFILESLVPRL